MHGFTTELFCGPEDAVKKIAYVIVCFPVLSETFVGTEMRAMQRLGHSIQPVAFTRYHGPYQEYDEQLKQTVIYLEDYNRLTCLRVLPYLSPDLFSGLDFIIRQQGLPLASLLCSALKLAYIVKKNNCGHIHAHFAQGSAATAIVAARLIGCTVSFVGHGYDVYASSSDLILKLNRADFAVAVCHDMANDFQRWAPQATIALVYCGIEQQRFRPRKQQPNNSNNRLLFIGRLCRTKGLGDLILAVKLLHRQQRPQLDIVGDGDLKAQLTQLIQDNDLSDFIHLLGPKQSAWLIQYGPDYAGLVAPFKMAPNGDRDTGPVVIKEAMAMSVPIIATYFMGCKEMLAEGSAIRVKPGDIFGLARAIRYFMTMPALERQTMSGKASQRVQRYFTADLQARRLSAYVEKKSAALPDIYYQLSHDG